MLAQAPLWSGDGLGNPRGNAAHIPRRIPLARGVLHPQHRQHRHALANRISGGVVIDQLARRTFLYQKSKISPELASDKGDAVGQHRYLRTKVLNDV